MIEELELTDKVEVRTGFIDENEMQILASESSILVLPYEDAFIEVSGVAHDFAAFGPAMICASIPRFEEFRDGFECLKTSGRPVDIGAAILLLLENETMRDFLSNNLIALAHLQSWSRVGDVRIELYRGLLRP